LLRLEAVDREAERHLAGGDQRRKRPVPLAHRDDFGGDDVAEQPQPSLDWLMPASRRIESPLRDTLTVIDSAAMLDDARKWKELYQRTIIGPSR
jgi:hypothetical protein